LANEGPGSEPGPRSAFPGHLDKEHDVKIAVTGASGLIGGALLSALRSGGHEVLQLVRRTPRTADEHRWDPQHQRIAPGLLADVDAVVNLAGTPIRPRPFTSGYKQQLTSSRLDATTTISQALAAAAAAEPDRRRGLLSASAGGVFGGNRAPTPTPADHPGPAPRRRRRAGPPAGPAVGVRGRLLRRHRVPHRDRARPRR